MPVEDYNQYNFKNQLKMTLVKFSICFDILNPLKRVSITKRCNNVFHETFEKMVNQRMCLPTCPMCRTDLYPQRHQ